VKLKEHGIFSAVRLTPRNVLKVCSLIDNAKSARDPLREVESLLREKSEMSESKRNEERRREMRQKFM
jgi:hypothetical protein